MITQPVEEKGHIVSYRGGIGKNQLRRTAEQPFNTKMVPGSAFTERSRIQRTQIIDRGSDSIMVDNENSGQHSRPIGWTKEGSALRAIPSNHPMDSNRQSVFDDVYAGIIVSLRP